MLIFRQPIVLKVLDGTKIAVRIAARNGRWHSGDICKAGTNNFQESTFANVKIAVEPYQQELRLMTPEDAWAEGHYTIHDTCKNKILDKIYARICCRHCKHKVTCYQFEWIKTNGIWRPRDMVWVVHFELSEVLKDKYDTKPVAGELGRGIKAVA